MSESGASRWLESQLSRHLASVRAPEELWDRIEQPATTPPQASAPSWTRWAIAAAVLVGALWLPNRLHVPAVHTIVRAAVPSDLNPDHCPLQCAPPLVSPVYQVAEFSGRGVPSYVVSNVPAQHTGACNHCHATAN